MATAVVWFLLRHRPAIRGKVMDFSASAGLAFLVGWKLSPLLWSPAALLRAPMTILYTPGGIWGSVVGAAAAVITLVIVARRQKRRVAVLGVPVVLIAGIALGFYGIAQGGFSIAENTRGEAGSLGYAPEVLQEDLRVLGGDTTTLEELQHGVGESESGPLVLNFWATWCGPCKAENPVKRAAHNRWKGEAKLIGVNLTESEGGVNVVRAYVDEERIPYTVVLDSGGTLQRAFGIHGTPTTIILAGNGKVIDRRYGPMTRGWVNGSIRRAIESSAREAQVGAR